MSVLRKPKSSKVAQLFLAELGVLWICRYVQINWVQYCLFIPSYAVMLASMSEIGAAFIHTFAFDHMDKSIHDYYQWYTFVYAPTSLLRARWKGYSLSFCFISFLLFMMLQIWGGKHEIWRNPIHFPLFKETFLFDHKDETNDSWNLLCSYNIIKVKE